MKLSILICTLTKRNSTFFSKLNNVLSKQDHKDVEILYLGDNKKRSVGKKRNDLVNLAQGEYICFVDDDDMISNNFVITLLEGIKQGTDIVNYGVSCSVNGSKYLPVSYSIKYAKDVNIPDKMYLRLPNHLMCVKRSIALKVPYKEISLGEDSDYALRLKKHLKTEYNINKILYWYTFNNSTSETQ